jgi:CRISPR/Cas system-associated exonuclease Cas4 (RecB family)
MESFLEKLVRHLCEKYPQDISNLCIVLPNRRAGIFLKTYFSKNINKTFWAPQIIAIEDFITLLSELQPADTTTVLFELYDVVKKIDKENVESFDEFSKWGQILLNDFNEIDRYCVNAKDLFLNLKEFKELEAFSLNSDELTEFQKQYLHFFQSLAKYYELFVQQLLAKKIAYQGLAYKIVEQTISEKIKKHKWDKIIFAGFNALNKAEEKIITQLLSEYKAEMIWDTDAYYANDKNQEAGFFYRKFKASAHFSKQWEKCTVFDDNLLATEDKKIEIIGVAKNIGQAKIAGNIINELSEKGVDLQHTALVLADENLLFPVLHSLPTTIADINVTMGYPLKNTPVFSYIDLVFNLHENAQKIAGNTKKYSYYHSDILKLLTHPYNVILFGDGVLQVREIVNTIISRNIVFASENTIKKMVTAFDIEIADKIMLFFRQWESPKDALDCVSLTISNLKDGIVDKQQKENDNKTSLELEYLFAFVKIINKIQTLSIEYNTSIDSIKTLRSIFNQIVRATTLPFYGEPLMGLQVMGMLETRTLDFENVILLSCNEDVLPSAKTVNSFIPFEIKRFFGLPTYGDKDSIFSYHFYRLIQRAKNIYLIHNTETNEFGNGERSRYVTQLMHELPQSNTAIKISEQVVTLPLDIKNGSNEINIKKTDDIIERIKSIADYGFSPSMLNKYISCPLKFYFHAIAGMREAEEVEENIGADVLGTVVHKVLEILYTPYIGKNISEAAIQSMLDKVEEITKDIFEKEYSKTELYYGKNLLTLKVALRFIINFLEQELRLLNSNKSKPLRIKYLEQVLETELDVDGFKIKFKGNADRVDMWGDIVRIIDYKTGVVKDNELQIQDLDVLKLESKYSKSFQLLMYAYMYKKSQGNVAEKLVSGIVTFRELTKGVKTVKFDKSDVLSTELLLEFENILKDVIKELFDKSVLFSQTEDTDNCLYCSFKGICNR